MSYMIHITSNIFILGLTLVKVSDFYLTTVYNKINVKKEIFKNTKTILEKYINL